MTVSRKQNLCLRQVIQRMNIIGEILPHSHVNAIQPDFARIGRQATMNKCRSIDHRDYVFLQQPGPVLSLCSESTTHREETRREFLVEFCSQCLIRGFLIPIGE